jgi:hypothetical protein
MLQKLIDLYEDKKLYKANFCDSWATSLLRPLGFAFALLGGTCPCCAGVRLVAVAVLAALYPAYTFIALASFLVTATAYRVYTGEPDES